MLLVPAVTLMARVRENGLDPCQVTCFGAETQREAVEMPRAINDSRICKEELPALRTVELFAGRLFVPGCRRRCRYLAGDGGVGTDGGARVVEMQRETRVPGW